MPSPLCCDICCGNGELQCDKCRSWICVECVPRHAAQCAGEVRSGVAPVTVFGDPTGALQLSAVGRKTRPPRKGMG